MATRKNELPAVELIVHVKALALAIALVHVLMLSWLSGKVLVGAPAFAKVPPEVLLVACLIVAVLFCAYCAARGVMASAAKVLMSRRFDLLLPFFVGCAAGYWLYQAIGRLYWLWIVRADATLHAVLWLAVLAWPVSYFVRPLVWRRQAAHSSSFLDDLEICSAEEDRLGIAQRAEDYAGQVLNAKSAVVFGIDAPWGTGKSSFVSLCSNFWLKQGAVVYRFEPLRFSDDSNLVERFVSDLIAEVQKQCFVPELRPALKRYAASIKGKTEFGLSPAKVTLEAGHGTVDDAIDDLGLQLERVGRQVVVVVDDLDRIGPSSAKRVLFAIKKGLALPNVNYVLCYDTEMLIEQTGTDSEHAREFLEKFVSVKIGLFVSARSLVAYMQEGLKQSLADDIRLSPQAVFTITSVVTAISEAYRGEGGWKYRSMLGDLRKVKRVVNLLLLLKIGDHEFENADFDKVDLLNLILLYLNYPGSFRSIYASEADGHIGSFSVRRENRSGSTTFSCAPGLAAWCSDRSENEVFLLNQLFNVETLSLNDLPHDIDEEVFHRTRACFNFPPTRNLERYLKLIVELSAPERTQSIAFYIGLFRRLIEGESIAALVDKLKSNHDESALSEFWRVVGSRAHELGASLVEQLLRFISATVPEYSLVEDKERGIGSRDEVVLALLRLLDEAWRENFSSNNSDENLRKVALLIFGENEGSFSILEALSEERRTVLGLYDLLLFRLYCGAGRSSLFNLSRALIMRYDSTLPTSGVVSELSKNAQRQVSQWIFGHFRRRYIEPARNLLADVDALTEEQLAGRMASALRENPERSTEQFAKTRNRVVVFTVYQLANRFTGNDVGCGFFDEEGGEDSGGIHVAMSAYLFDVCFEPSVERNRYRFCDYMLSHLERSFGGEQQVASVAGLVGGLDREALAYYWRDHRELFLPLARESRTVQTSNYVAEYSVHLPSVFTTLDQLAGGQGIGEPIPSEQ